MARVAIITDSSADLPPELAERAGITIVPVSDGISVDGTRRGARAHHDGGAMVMDPVGEVRPEIAGAFAGAFEEAARAHDEVVAVLLSGRLGSVVAAAQQAASERGPGLPIEIVDSRSASMGLGFQALQAAELAHAGQDATEIGQTLRAATDHYHVVFSVESVEHLRKSGQIGRAAAMIAEALQLKPLLRIDEGQIVPYERARTRARAITELAEFVCDLPVVERCAVLYATGGDDAVHLAEIIGAEMGLPPGRLTVARIGETVAAQVGPGALGVAVVEPMPEGVLPD